MKPKQLKLKFKKNDNIFTKCFKISQKSLLSMALLATFGFSLVDPSANVVASIINNDETGSNSATLRYGLEMAEERESGKLPESKDKIPVRAVGVHTISAYNSEVAQCDASPCITANGFNVCEHGIEDTIAANFLKFGTRVRIPDLFGERIFIVRDRMNSRYSNRVDVWMLDKQDARNFGIRTARIEVLD